MIKERSSHFVSENNKENEDLYFGVYIDPHFAFFQMHLLTLL